MSFLKELKRRNVFRVGAAYMVAAWLVIQVVETIFPIYGLSNASVRIVITILAIGLVPTLIFAWVFELTPEGLKKESEVNRSSSITPNTGKKLDRMIMVVLALALGYFAFDNFVLDPHRQAALQQENAAAVEQARQEGRSEALVASYGEKSIAVLAFDDMSPKGDQEYLSDGIAEELLNLLARIPDLRVISRSSAFSYKGKDIKLNQIAEELNVAHVLEGSVRKAGDQVRITAQLIEARSDTHLWSQTYDRQLDNIFKIQDEIAAAVIEQLKVTLLGEPPQVQETDPEAYALFLQARHLGTLNTEAGYEQSNALYFDVLEIDPDYADAWSRLAANYLNMAGTGLLPIDEGFANARQAVEKALAIDPGNALAYDSLGWIAMMHDNQLAQAARHYQRALQLEPTNTNIIGNVSSLLYLLGRLEDSMTVDEYVAARDPVNPISHVNLSIKYIATGRFSEAIEALETGLRLSPDYYSAQATLGMAHLFNGDILASLDRFQRETSEETKLTGLAMANHALNKTEDSDQALVELIDGYGQVTPSLVAAVFAYRDQADEAFEWLNSESIAGDPYIMVLNFPPFSGLRSDQRWLPFLASIGRSPTQLDAIKFEVTLP